VTKLLPVVLLAPNWGKIARANICLSTPTAGSDVSFILATDPKPESTDAGFSRYAVTTG
jgi:hypothetical protein